MSFSRIQFFILSRCRFFCPACLPQHIERTRRPPNSSAGSSSRVGFGDSEVAHRGGQIQGKSIGPGFGRSSPKCACEGRKTPRWIHGRRAHRRTESEVKSLEMRDALDVGDIETISSLGPLIAKGAHQMRESCRFFTSVLFRGILAVQDLQCAWLLLLLPDWSELLTMRTCGTVPWSCWTSKGL